MGSLIQVLEETLAVFACANVVLDALDECFDREDLLRIPETMNGWRQESLHILVTSRRERDLKEGLQGLTTIET